MTHSWTTEEAGLGPLTGVRVVALAGMGPLPFACMLLSDLGADVVRVGRPPWRPARHLEQAAAVGHHKDVVNRGLRFVTADLKSDVGIENVLQLAEKADVFVEGFRPGVAEGLGLGPKVLLDVKGTLVYARLTGYGQFGDLAGTAGHDINFVAQTGVLHALGTEGNNPRPPLNLLGDYAGGGSIAAVGILAAVLHARAIGEGQILDAAAVDGVALLSAKYQSLRAAGALSDTPGANYLGGAAPYYATYRCADGRHVAVGALEDDFYQEFVSRLGVDVSRWPDQNDTSQWPLLRELIAEAIAARPMLEWQVIYAGTDSCVTPVLTFDEAASHPHNRERELFVDVEGVRHPQAAPRFSRSLTEPPAPPCSTSVSMQEILAAWS